MQFFNPSIINIIEDVFIMFLAEKLDNEILFIVFKNGGLFKSFPRHFFIIIEITVKGKEWNFAIVI